MKQLNTIPKINRTLEYSNGSPVDLTGATVYFHMGVLSDSSPYRSGLCVVTGLTTGKCSYNWNTLDTAVPGAYWGEFEVNWGNGSIMTIPSDNNLKIKIYEGYN